MALRQAIAEALKLPESTRRYPQEEALISQYVVAFKLDEQIAAASELVEATRKQEPV
jgi:hypothetical protein